MLILNIKSPRIDSIKAQRLIVILQQLGFITELQAAKALDEITGAETSVHIGIFSQEYWMRMPLDGREEL